MKNFNLKLSILAPLGFVSIIVWVAFVAGIYKEEQGHMTEALESDIRAVEGYYLEALNERSYKLGAALEMIAADREMKEAVSSRDRKRLFNQFSHIFEKLKSQYNITHFYFHDPQRVNILRVHHQQRFGDVINRHTLIRAQETESFFYGAELGVLGTFTLRAVIPIWDNGHILGYIELGEEIEPLIHDMTHVFDVNLVVAISKKYLNKNDWNLGVQMLGKKSVWEQFSHSVVVSSTLPAKPSELDTILAEPITSFTPSNLNFILSDQQYRGRAITLQDAGQRNVGQLIVLRDMTGIIQSTNNTVLTISLSVLILGFLLFFIFYIILGNAERHLKKLWSRAKEKQLLLSQAQHIAHLGNWEWDIQSGVVDCSDEASTILGHESTLSAHYKPLLKVVHPTDRRSFRLFIQKVCDDGKIYGLTHRIVRDDGAVRYVSQRAEVLRNDQGLPKKVRATIHDITELKKAELRSARMGRILEHSWDEIYVFDAKTLHLMEMSKGCYQNLGYSMNETKALALLDLIPEFSLDQFNSLIEPLRRGESHQIHFETNHIRKNRTLYPVSVRMQISEDEEPHVFIAIAQDISERKRHVEELEHKALYDTLTDLPNRTLLQDRLKYAINLAQRDTTSLAIFLIDIHHLREINDLLGHHNGDFVIKEIASRLQNKLRHSDTIARLGGDEFAIVLTNLNSDCLANTSEKILEVFQIPVILEDSPIELEVAIGIALYPEHGNDPSSLLQHADIAMHIAKSEARGYKVYDPYDSPFSVRTLKLHGELRQAIENKELTVYYQPQIDIKSGKIVGVEALARWPHATEGMISPADFIPMVEQSGLIRPFTLWVLEQAIQQTSVWCKAGYDLSVSVNLSTRNLLDTTLSDNIVQLLQYYQVSTDNLMLEVTESAVMSRPEQALKLLMHLQSLGLKISIDDFGTGYSSLAYLKKLPVSELKIDYSFISTMIDSTSDAIIVQSTIDLAHNLGLTVVAEGVEDKITLDKLHTYNCDIGQGYYFSRPVPAEELTNLLVAFNAPQALYRKQDQ